MFNLGLPWFRKRIAFGSVNLPDQYRPVAILNSRLGQLSIAGGYSLFIGLVWMLIPHPIVALVIPIVLGILPIAIIFALKNPFFMVLGFMIFSFFRIHEAFPALYPMKIPLLFSLGALSSLGWNLITKQLDIYLTRELKWFLWFFALVTLGVILASNRGIAMSYYTGTYVKMTIMVFAIAWLTRRPGDFGLAARMFVIAGIAIGIVALQNKANGIGLVEGTRVTIGRDIRSMLGDPNDLALVLLFPGSFAASLMLTKGIGFWSRLLGIVGCGVLVFAILATQSRGGLLGIMTISGIFGFRKIKNKFILFGGMAVAMMVLFVAAGITDRSSGGQAEDGVDESAMGRIYAWGAAWNMAITRPLTGVGLDNFYSNYFFYSSHWDGKNHAVHSTWFGVLGETGFPGIIVFVGFVATAAISAVRSVRWMEAGLGPGGKLEPQSYAMAQACVTGIASFCISGTFLTQGFTWPVYILLGLTAAVSRYMGMDNPDRLASVQAKPPP